MSRFRSISAMRRQFSLPWRRWKKKGAPLPPAENEALSVDMACVGLCGAADKQNF
jgi:hypothetical protein